jgi:hypothetical protein
VRSTSASIGRATRAAVCLTCISATMRCLALCAALVLLSALPVRSYLVSCWARATVVRLAIPARGPAAMAVQIVLDATPDARLKGAILH